MPRLSAVGISGLQGGEDVKGERLTRQLQAMSNLKTPGTRNRYRATVRAILRRAERDWDWIRQGSGDSSGA